MLAGLSAPDHRTLMGYVPPRPQRPDETLDEYIEYLERLLRERQLVNMLVLPTGVFLALLVVGLLLQ